MNRFGIAVLFFALGVIAVPAGVYLWLTHGHVPVAVADPSFPMEQTLVSKPLHARIEKEMPAGSPVPVNEATLTDGARIYQKDCAFCHGVPGKKALLGANMFPPAPQLWEPHHGDVGVSDDPVGESYWKVKNGIRLSAMPSYVNVLSETEMWEVSNLVKAADKPLPPSAQAYLHQVDGR